MIIERKGNNVEAIGLGQQKDFTIQANAEMFEMLSSGLYTDKIRAVIRELSTNAVDSMIEAGTINDKQFKVHLPTALEPTFSVRDYGTGLTPDEVMELYTSYGASTKRESNLFNGALGVGSKSPFSYVSTFNITSFKDGTCYQYSCYVENGSPKIMNLCENPTNEHNGLLIEVAVISKDIPQFKEKAESLYHWFEYKPETNIELLDIKVEMVVEGADKSWGIYERVGYNQQHILGGGAYVVMGNILYPIKGDVFEYDSLSYKFSNTPILIKAGIGDVRMSASRESLSMTPETIKWLENKFEGVSKELSVKIKKDIGLETTLWNKAVKYKDILSNMSSTLTKVLRVNIDNTTYSGEDFPDFETPSTALEGIKVMKYTSYRKSGTSAEGRAGNIYISPDKKMQFLLNDTASGGVKIAMKLRDKGYTVYLVKGGRDVIEEQFKKLSKKYLGGAEYKKVSDLYVKPVRATRGTKINPRDIEFSLVNIGSSVNRGHYTRYSSLVNEDTVFYFPLNSGFISYENNVVSEVRAPDVIRESKHILKELTKKDRVTLFGVNKSDMKYLSGLTNMVNVVEYISKNIKKVVSKNNPVYEEYLSDWDMRRFFAQCEVIPEIKRTHLGKVANKIMGYGRAKSNSFTYDDALCKMVFKKTVTYETNPGEEIDIPKEYPLYRRAHTFTKEQMLYYIKIQDEFNKNNKEVK